MFTKPNKSQSIAGRVSTQRLILPCLAAVAHLDCWWIPFRRDFAIHFDLVFADEVVWITAAKLFDGFA
jgi:hypothetical protein